MCMKGGVEGPALQMIKPWERARGLERLGFFKTVTSPIVPAATRAFCKS